MKTFLSALIALCFITGVAGPVIALDAKSFYEQFDRSHYAKDYDWTAGGGALRGLNK